MMHSFGRACVTRAVFFHAVQMFTYVNLAQSMHEHNEQKNDMIFQLYLTLVSILLHFLLNLNFP